MEQTPLSLTVQSQYSNVETDGSYINPCIRSPSSPIDLYFYQTRETLADVDEYKRFIENIIRRFRSTRFYKGYKAYLYEIGLNRCQIFGNIDNDMAPLEMHHNIITIFDIALMICEHLLSTVGFICTFDIILLLEEEHRANRVPIVMLSETPHDLYHNDPGFFIPPESTFGKWWELFARYRYGITIDIAYKVQDYIKLCMESKNTYTNDIIQVGNAINEWSGMNVYGMPAAYCGYINASAPDTLYRLAG